MSTASPPNPADGAGGEEASVRSRYRGPVAIAVAAVCGAALIHNGAADDHGPPQPGRAAALASPSPSARPSGAAREDRGRPGDEESASGADGDDEAGPAAARPLPYAEPLRIRIPRISVDAPVMKVGLDDDGWIAAPPPEDTNLTAWYKDAASPGERGTAVIDGHVDNVHGPSVFYGLGALRKGDRIEVARGDGRTAVFTIYGIEVFAKDHFPGDRVYGDIGKPELRVITCGGGYTKKHGYAGNVVVFARLTGVRAVE
ncbi:MULTISPECIES: class F sortase [Streptomycetaceae]|uniref:Secreted protein n=1 Tax=Streptantibioticus cattleyicolor (strain ATCC 35852 / DSM 46488 / JCM 4925 / NBRC 14057 / NRRL 8057) TaxID=1003195 RepID=F8JWT8_STREN|nr:MULTISPECIES: class F sortase [Streptomycetaceae]AEW97097.1 secreted protein [Streptantibioticus cattleyicolor NRRL 8057 = DSM 46488]MYS61557.1 class F sortase [Streptomyces sp. SID5468]CCB77420.1 putative secreted protein [Streptantibioticus cattleyicolor NRRL 8057 = DSM 46488]